MSEYIDRDSAREIIEELQKSLCPVGRYGRGYVYGIERDMYDELEKILDDVDAIPAADVVEMVRCGECLYHREKNKKESAYLEPNVIVCTNLNIFEDGCGFMWRTDFCSYGERKE